MVGNSDSKVRLSRRAVIAASGVVLAAAGVYIAFGGDGVDAESKGPSKATKKKSEPSNGAKRKVDALLKNFSYLKLSREDVEKYVADYGKRFGRRGNRLNDAFYTTFLLSSDFFLNGADVNKPVTYLVLHDPARVPCHNPFARYD